MFTEVYTWFDALDDLTHSPRRDCWAWHSWRMPSKGGVRNTKTRYGAHTRSCTERR